MSSRPLTTLFVAASLVLIAALPLLAHHSFSAQFDRSKPVTLSGTVTKVQWTNPHIWFYIDVKDPETGKITNWGLEMGSPNALFRLGWTQHSLKPGDIVTTNGFLARNGTNTANAIDVTLSNGRKVLTGSSAESELTRK
jgi:hypothetical protein